MKRVLRRFLFVLFTLIFFINSGLSIDIDVLPSGYTPCPPNVFGNCTADTYYGSLQIDYRFTDETNNEIGFRVRKCDLSNFTQGGTLYIKEGDEVCSDIVNSVSFSAGVDYINITFPLDYWITGTIDVTATLTSNSTEKFWTGVLQVTKNCSDFQVSNVSCSSTELYQGQSGLQASCLIENLGNEPESNDVKFYISTNTTYSPNDIYIGREGFTLSAGASEILTQSFSVPENISPGGYYIVAVADIDDVEVECQEWNNASFTFVQISGAPNLEFNNLDLNNLLTCEGETIPISFKIKNSGSINVFQDFEVDFYLSGNTSIGGSDILLTTTLVTTNIGPGGTTSTINLNLSLPQGEDGDFYIIGDIDPSNQVLEQNEYNNERHTLSQFDIKETPKLYTPINGETVNTSSPLLDWRGLGPTGTIDYTVTIRDASHNIIHSHTTEIHSYEVPSGILYENEIYTWEVQAHYGTIICQSIQESFFVACSDSYEPNNTNTNPDVTAFNTLGISGSNQVIQSYISADTDVDYYRITVTTTGSFSISLYSLPLNYDLELWPIDYTSELATSTNSGTTSESISYNHQGGNQEYLIKVYSYFNEFDCSDSYSLSIDWTPTISGSSLELNGPISTNPTPIIYNQIGEFNYSVRNTSSTSYVGQVRLELLDGSSSLPPLNVIDEYNDFYLNGNSSVSLDFSTPDPVSTIPGDYNLRVTYSDDNGVTWNQIGNGPYVQPQPFQIVETPIKLNAPISVTPSIVYQGGSAQFQTEVINFGNTTFYDSISLNLLDENLVFITPLEKGKYNLIPGQMQTLTFSTNEVGSDPGIYHIRVDVHKNGQWYPAYQGNYSNPISFVISPPQNEITITSPTSSDNFTSGENLPVTWVIEGTVGNISLELRDVSNNFLKLIADGISSSSGFFGLYDLPTCLATGDYQIKVYETGTGNYETYSQLFSVTKHPDCICTIDIPSLSNGDEQELVDAANWLCSQDIIDDVLDTRPYDPITRGELAKMVFNALFDDRGIKPSDNFPSPFLDLQNKNDWFYRAAKALSYLEYDDGITPFDRNKEFRFRPEDPIERTYVLKVLLEAMNIYEDPLIPENFSDVTVGTTGYPYIVTAGDMCLINTNLPTFRPLEFATRGEVFLMIYRLLESPCALSKYTKPIPEIEDYFCPGNQSPSNMSRNIGIDEGNFHQYTMTSFSLPGVGLSLEFGHGYNLYLTDLPDDFFPMRPLGYGWSHTYNSYIVDVPLWNETNQSVEQKLVLFFPSGAIQVYENPQANYPYQCSVETQGVYETLTYESSTTIKVKTKSQVVYTYQKMSVGENKEAFLITQIKDRNDHTINIYYEIGEGSGDPMRISQVVRELDNVKTAERTLHFDYQSGTNYISLVYLNISGQGGTSIAFNVNEDSDLKSFTDRMAAITTYNYIKDINPTADLAEIDKKKHLLFSITLPKGNTITNTYQKRKLNSTNTNNKLVTNIDVTFNYQQATLGIQSDIETTSSDLGFIPYTKHVEFDENNEGKIKTVNVNGVIQSFLYDHPSNPYLPTKITDTNRGLVIDISYDALGNLTGKEYYLNGSSSPAYTFIYDYNMYNDLVQITDPSSNDVVLDYGTQPEKGLVASITDQNNYVTQYNYYNPSEGQWKNGALKSIISPENIQVDFTYDLYGNQNGLEAPGNISSSSIYDGLGRVISSITPNNNTYAYTYYDNDLPHISTNPLNHTIEYGYDANYNLKTIKNERGFTTHLNYEFDTDLLSTTSFEGSLMQYQYYSDGRLKKIIKPDNTIVDISYISSDQGLGQVKDDGYATYTYDLLNRLKTVSKNNNGTNHVITYHYDPLDRITSYDYLVQGSSGYSYSVGYEYNANGNISKIKYPNLGGIGTLDVVYRYYDNNWLKEVEDWEGKITSFTYYGDGGINAMSYPNGTNTIFHYEPETRRVDGMHDERSDGSIFNSYSFTLDKEGNILTESRLDPNGIVALPARNTTMTYKTNNFIESVNGVPYQVNPNGNLENDGVNTYTWDNGYDFLSSINGTINYNYDGLGLRRERLENGSGIKYIWDVSGIGNVIGETNLNGNVISYYIYAGSTLLYRKVPNGSGYDDGVYHYNYQGSTVAISNEQEALTHTYSYSPYGKCIYKGESDYNPFTFIGKFGVAKENDSFYYMRARYYNAEIGRFISQDPVWGTNLFEYSEGNPVNMIDPTGLTAQAFGGSVAGMPPELIPPQDPGYAIMTNPDPSIWRTIDRFIGYSEWYYTQGGEQRLKELGQIIEITSFLYGGGAITKADDAYNALRYGGKSFNKYKKLYWSKNQKPTLDALINPKTGEKWIQYVELDHIIIPQRASWAPNWLKNNIFNIKPKSSLYHAMTDPYRARFAPKWVKDLYNLKWR